MKDYINDSCVTLIPDALMKRFLKEHEQYNIQLQQALDRAIDTWLHEAFEHKSKPEPKTNWTKEGF